MPEGTPRKWVQQIWALKLFWNILICYLALFEINWNFSILDYQNYPNMSAANLGLETILNHIDLALFENDLNYLGFKLSELSEGECSRFVLQTQLLHWPADLQANRLTPSSTFCTRPSSFTEQILKIPGPTTTIQM